MRILTVRQPWAWAIIHGGKNIENRVRNIAGTYRGPVAIHVAKTIAKIDYASYLHVESRGYDAKVEQHLGEIVGVVDLTDVHSASVIGGCGRVQHDCDEHPNGCRHHCSPWAMGPAPEGWYQHLVFENPRALDEPIPFKGTLGLRRLDDDMIARINRALP
jgi:hypothetical protein